MEKLDVKEYEKEFEKLAHKLDNTLNCVKDVSNRMNSTESFVSVYLPYNIFVKIQNLLHMAFRGTVYLEKAKEYETEQLKAFVLEILADEHEHRVDSVELLDPPGTRS